MNTEYTVYSTCSTQVRITAQPDSHQCLCALVENTGLELNEECRKWEQAAVLMTAVAALLAENIYSNDNNIS